MSALQVIKQITLQPIKLRTHLNPMTGGALTTRFPVITVQFMNGVRVLGSLPVTVPPGHSANHDTCTTVGSTHSHTVPLGHVPSHITHSPPIIDW